MWPRLSEDLTRERTRLANRMRNQLWRYYPQLLATIGDDGAAPWALELRKSLPTPPAGQRVREATLARREPGGPPQASRDAPGAPVRA